MRAPPTGFLIEAFLVALDTVPTKKVLSIVGADRFNHVLGFAIAPLATAYRMMLWSLHEFQLLPASTPFAMGQINEYWVRERTLRTFASDFAFFALKSSNAEAAEDFAEVRRSTRGIR